MSYLFTEKLPEETIPDYDADSEDEEWLEASFSFNASKTTLTKSIFEGMMEKLEKSSGQQVCVRRMSTIKLNEFEFSGLSDYRPPP